MDSMRQVAYDYIGVILNIIYNESALESPWKLELEIIDIFSICFSYPLEKAYLHTFQKI